MLPRDRGFNPNLSGVQQSCARKRNPLDRFAMCGGCGLGQAAPNPLLTLFRYFPDVR